MSVRRELHSFGAVRRGQRSLLGRLRPHALSVAAFGFVCASLSGCGSDGAGSTKDRPLPRLESRVIGVPTDRVLRVQYVTDGCGGQVRKRESDDTVTIVAEQRPDDGSVCALMEQSVTMDVTLKRAIAGRRLGGERWSERSPGVPRCDQSKCLSELPRVIGLAGPDAKRVLSSQRIRSTARGNGTVVVGQVPSPGTVLKAGQQVLLELR